MQTRRAHLAALGLIAAAAPAAAAPPTAAAPAAGHGGASRPGTRPDAPLELTARRTKITLPGAPTLGISYIALLDLFDASGAKVGQASTSSFVVDVTVTGGPIVLGFIVLQLEAGDIHYQRIIRRHGNYPRTATGAITGGTGSYEAAAGHVEVTWPDPEVVELVVHLA